MIPLKLQLKNFLSYGSELQTIDFGLYHLICLSGKNGHGKSALLDAITWALWGQARKVNATAKPDQGLLRLGQRQMIVIFDFAFNGKQYRVRREFTSAYGKTYAYLDFGMVEPEDVERVVAMTGKTIRETQQTIESLLGLDYEAFINSAFLRQGSSNEFSKKAPRERKEILCAILGLDRFEQLRKLATERTKQEGAHKDAILKLQERFAVEVQGIDTLKAQLLQVDAQLTNMQQKEGTLLTTLQAYEQENQACMQQMHTYTALIKQRNQLEHTIIQESAAIKELYSVWKKVHRQLIMMPDKQVLEEKKKQVGISLHNWQTILAKMLACKEQYLRCKEQEQQQRLLFEHENNKRIQDTLLLRERLMAQLTTVQNQHNALEQECLHHTKVMVEIDREIGTMHVQEQKLAATCHDIVAIEKQFERRKEYYHTLVARGNIASTELEALQKKQTIVHDDDNPSCPLCLQNLSASRKRYLKTQLEQQHAFLNHRIPRIKKILASLKEMLVEQHKQLQEKKQAADQLALLRIRYKDIHSKRQELHHNSQLLQEKMTILQKERQQCMHEQQEVERRIADHAAQTVLLLQQNKEYQALLAALEAFPKTLEQLAYDQDAHEHVQRELAVIEQTLQTLAQAEAERARQQERRNFISQQCLFVKNLKKNVQQCMLELTAMGAVEERYTTAEKALHEHKKLLKDCAISKEQAFEQRGRLQAQLTTLEKVANEHKAQEQQLVRIEQTIAAYKEIGIALSKDGIQALLIEEAIPEIEQEANYLLAKLTDNQAQLFIESVRDLKKGGTKETLDINIADGAGIRPYEMFSGGEAFRIDFALRIAISKLLARRAGTSLQTLIIDEGFGSQDEEGLTHIMDALYKIQEDFAKIIIVSHLPTMKDQFPVHFVVEKGGSGSKVTIVEQG